ncbi:hypothetical protein SLEP1_g53717 [Rubroshorea leprosula]|uniref:Uncharacterized protein n=1 Tax=Rubroshorea leprosula TaxID=152421 RepID=A0AAV5MBB4_9ROSI|nr:hypothetical protein SLEP1_g53717 [Rubroshorea leprosula]
MYGRVVDVYLPSKRDKRGKRYGFVRLIGVKDEIQMERRLNEIWIGSMNRLVQPGHSYAQAVKGQGKREDKVAEHLQEKVKEAVLEKEVVKTGIQENMEVEKTEEIIEYTPTKEELQWLEGGMVAVVRSMALVSEIQEQMDADGGSITLSPIGGRRVLLTERVAGFLSDYMKHNQELFGLWFESIKPWETAPEEKSRMMWDTKKKSILWDGRVLILCSDSSKISKQVKLKVEEQVYEIEIVEEEWHSDPDWWLSENDQRSDLETESDYSNSWCQNEDQELDSDVIGDDEDTSNGSEHLMKDLVSISNPRMATVMEKCNQSVQEVELDGNASFELSEEGGPQRLSCGGLEENNGLTNRMDWGLITEMSIEEPILHAQNQTDSPSIQKSGNSKKVSKKQRLLKECYPESMEEIWAKAVLRVTPRTRQRQERREGSSQAGDEKVCNAVAVSISDGCIENRNRVLQREMNMHEVRRMMGVGRRLGLNFGNNEDEIQSKLLEVIDQEGARRRDMSGLQKKVTLWEELRSMVTDNEGCWLIAGDFNAVRGPGERRGRTGESPDMKDFDEFIVSTDLVDVKLTNRRYTWYKPDGTARSRLDIFLLSTKMSNLEGEWIQQGLPRNISDHCAIVLKSRSADWGPRPFRVLDAWQQHLDFKKFVEDKWSEMEVEGFVGYKCQQKLKLLKGFLKGWNKEVFGNMETQYEQAVKKIEQVDMQNEISDLEDAEIVKRQEGFSKMWEVLRKKELIWKQKSRNILEACFKESWNRPKPGDIRFHQISEEKKDWLERPFSVEEIEEGLRSCDGSKAPRPNGYNFNFLKFAWHYIKEDFINFFSEFHRNESRLWNKVERLGRRTVPIGGAIKLDRPSSLASQGSEHIVHVRTRREREITILSETGQHMASDGTAVSLSELRPFLLLLPLSFPFGGGKCIR